MIFPKFFRKALHCKCDVDKDVVQPRRLSSAQLPGEISEEVLFLGDFDGVGSVMMQSRCHSLRSSRTSLDFMDSHLYQSAVTELPRGNLARRTVETIFKTSWMDPQNPQLLQPRIDTVLKMNHTVTAVSKFEEYREKVQCRARGKQKLRCMVDGNEVLSYHPTSLSCPPQSCIPCKTVSCSACKILRNGFKGPTIYTTSSSFKAHVTSTDTSARRAMLICRVIAGCIQIPPETNTGSETEVYGDQDEPEESYDSVAVDKGLEELIVFNPTAILPCYLVVYS